MGEGADAAGAAADEADKRRALTESEEIIEEVRDGCASRYVFGRQIKGVVSMEGRGGSKKSRILAFFACDGDGTYLRGGM